MILQNRLNEIRNYERIKEKVLNWKHFKKHWKNWRLIDFYEFLQRINNRKYSKYFLNFEIFYQEWMNIYYKDIKNKNDRFKSHIFIGNNLLYFDHNDLIKIGINLKEDRRAILCRIQGLKGYRSR